MHSHLAIKFACDLPTITFFLAPLCMCMLLLLATTNCTHPWTFLAHSACLCSLILTQGSSKVLTLCWIPLANDISHSTLSHKSHCTNMSHAGVYKLPRHNPQATSVAHYSMHLNLDELYFSFASHASTLSTTWHTFLTPSCLEHSMT